MRDIRQTRYFRSGELDTTTPVSRLVNRLYEVRRPRMAIVRVFAGLPAGGHLIVRYRRSDGRSIRRRMTEQQVCRSIDRGAVLQASFHHSCIRRSNGFMAVTTSPVGFTLSA